MENTQKDQGMIYDRITGLENRISTVDDKVEELEDKVEVIKDKNDERHLEMVKLTTELKGTSKATEQNTNRMANSIEGLVSELKQSNSRTDDRFSEINRDVQEVKNKVEGQEHKETMKLEDKKMSNKTLGFIIAGVFGVLQIIIQVIAPALGLG